MLTNSNNFNPGRQGPNHTWYLMLLLGLSFVLCYLLVKQTNENRALQNSILFLEQAVEQEHYSLQQKFDSLHEHIREYEQEHEIIYRKLASFEQQKQELNEHFNQKQLVVADISTADSLYHAIARYYQDRPEWVDSFYRYPSGFN